jgi:hypothetical protein
VCVRVRDADAAKCSYDDSQGRFVNDSSKRKPKQPEAGTSEIAEARDRRISDLGSRQPQIPVSSLSLPGRLRHCRQQQKK